jgi:hypothetical protein
VIPKSTVIIIKVKNKNQLETKTNEGAGAVEKMAESRPLEHALEREKEKAKPYYSLLLASAAAALLLLPGIRGSSSALARPFSLLAPSLLFA